MITLFCKIIVHIHFSSPMAFLSLHFSSIGAGNIILQCVTQENPNIVSREIKNDSAITQVLVEQNTNIDDPEKLVNDLERTRNKRVEKWDKPKESAAPIIGQAPVRHALLSQLLSNQGYDTEEILSLRPLSSPIQPSTPTLLSSPDKIN